MRQVVTGNCSAHVTKVCRIYHGQLCGWNWCIFHTLNSPVAGGYYMMKGHRGPEHADHTWKHDCRPACADAVSDSGFLPAMGGRAGALASAVGATGVSRGPMRALSAGSRRRKRLPLGLVCVICAVAGCGGKFALAGGAG